MARRLPLRGRIRIRKLLRAMPDAVRGEIIVELHLAGRRIAAAMRARARRKTGFLRSGIFYNVLPKTLRLQVGLLARRGPRGDPRFYGRIQDRGRRAQIVNVTRRVAKGAGARVSASGKPVMRRSRGKANLGVLRQVGSPYKMQVPAMAGTEFVTGRYPELRGELRRNLGGVMTRALQRIAGGGDE